MFGQGYFKTDSVKKIALIIFCAVCFIHYSTAISCGASLKTYESKAIGVDFDYPGEYRIEESFDENGAFESLQIFLGRETKNSISTVKTYKYNEEENFEKTANIAEDRFKDFSVQVIMRIFPLADGPDGSIYAEVESAVPFETRYGIKGYELQVFEIHSSYDEQEQPKTDRFLRGPFYAFDFPGISNGGILLMSVAFDISSVDRLIIKDVVESVRKSRGAGAIDAHEKLINSSN